MTQRNLTIKDEEKSARSRDLLRQPNSRPAPEPLTAQGLTLDPVRRTVAMNDTPVELTKREFDLLQYLLENRDQVVSRDSLLDHIWGADYLGETNVVDVCIRSLRNKIDGVFGIKLITTVRGEGYVVREHTS